jgi:hypothetical protein
MGRWISGGVTASLLRSSGDRCGADALLIGLQPVHERELFAIKAHEASPSQLDIIHEQGDGRPRGSRSGPGPEEKRLEEPCLWVA